jgi:hypothetical protein
MTNQNWFPEAWNPNPGDTITGFVVKLGVADGGWGPYPVVTLRTTQVPQGEVDVAVHAFHDMLQSELVDRQVQAGDQLTITYLGKHPEKNYHGYRVAGTDRPFDWTQFGARGDTPTQAHAPAASSSPPGRQEQRAPAPATGDSRGHVTGQRATVPPDVPVNQDDFEPPPQSHPADDDIPFLHDGFPSWIERREHANR